MNQPKHADAYRQIGAILDLLEQTEPHKALANISLVYMMLAIMYRKAETLLEARDAMEGALKIAHKDLAMDPGPVLASMVELDKWLKQNKR